MSGKIGFTSTVPVEIILRAGFTPVDLNNTFITSDEPHEMVAGAERFGFPRNLCAWIKGIYSAVVENDIDKIICIGEGDCASAVSMCEILQEQQIEIIPFSYPMFNDKERLLYELESLARNLGTTLDEAESVRLELLSIRQKLKEVDRLTWEEGKVSGKENHFCLVNSSDFNGKPDMFEKRLDKFLSEAKRREPKKYKRIGYIGVPPIIDDVYDYIVELGGDVVYNETQRQFSFPYDAENLLEQYSLYTYPYGIKHRLEYDILPEIDAREIEGVIHYVQSFCHRQIEDILVREYIHLPFLMLEVDKPGKLDNRTKIRIEAFMEML
jgi:benzoyl-CoA reductase/2-hydroxyglutaryl-CoA dehydratase subunit BcrC/BadD/HgdB